MSRQPFKSRILAAMSLLLLSASIADAAWPRLLMIFGKPLEKPIVVQDRLEVVDVFDGNGDGANRDGLEARPNFELALFWGETWNRYMDEQKPVDRLRPEDVTPFENIPIHGRFYPACGSSPAQITLTAVGSQTIQSIWLVSEKGLKILQRLGVPTRVDCK